MGVREKERGLGMVAAHLHRDSAIWHDACCAELAYRRKGDDDTARAWRGVTECPFHVRVMVQHCICGEAACEWNARDGTTECWYSAQSPSALCVAVFDGLESEVVCAWQNYRQAQK